MATAGQWWGGARVRTLPAAIAPVAVGTGLAAHVDAFIAVRALLALVVAVALQIGVNFANDYSDGIRGTDTNRVGPMRLVGQGLAKPSHVKFAAFVCFGVAGVAGLVLIAMTHQWWLIIIGIACIVAAWSYTGGSQPYGYRGLGEIFVFIFFGLVPVMGTAYVQTLSFSLIAIVGGAGVGALACAILVTNNLRDIPGDTMSGKQTLAVRLGDAATRRLYTLLIIVGVASPVVLAALSSPLVVIGCVTALLAIPPLRLVNGGALGPALVPALKQTGLLLLVFGLVVGGLLALT
ncbi:MAG: 1,4-dihydroxy-2-naphthoate polyprenyltransferase [Actinomycetes bacterium]|jgi:1,4-dihydroxy-2-naphthoate octaprenyltransferase